MFTIRNAVLVALMQVGVIVAGVLGAGVCHRIFINSYAHIVPLRIEFLMKYGGFGFLLPLIWIIAALVAHSRPEVSDQEKTRIFWSGVLLLLGLVAWVIYADFGSWFLIRGMG